MSVALVAGRPASLRRSGPAALLSYLPAGQSADRSGQAILTLVAATFADILQASKQREAQSAASEDETRKRERLAGERERESAREKGKIAATLFSFGYHHQERWKRFEHNYAVHLVLTSLICYFSKSVRVYVCVCLVSRAIAFII